MATLSLLPGAELPEKYHNFQDVFSCKEADALPSHRLTDCSIDLIPGANLLTGRLYALSELKLKSLHEYLDKNLEGGYTSPSKSPLSALVLFNKKKSGELCLCNGSHALNRITQRNCFPLPLIPELFAWRLRATPN